MLVCEMMALQNSVAVFKFFLMSVRWPLVFLTPLSELNFIHMIIHLMMLLLVIISLNPKDLHIIYKTFKNVVIIV